MYSRTNCLMIYDLGLTRTDTEDNGFNSGYLTAWSTFNIS